MNVKFGRDWSLSRLCPVPWVISLVAVGRTGTVRSYEAALRREVRQSQKRQRELERLSKEQAKLSAQEQARLEVETYENALEVLLSVQKEQGPIWDWVQIASSLPIPCPQRHSYHELRTLQTISVSPGRKISADAEIEDAKMKDQGIFDQQLQSYTTEMAEWKRLKDLADRILSREHKAYIEALVENSPLRELSSLGSMLHFTIHDDEVIECEMKVNGTQAIPAEVKSLTSTGKVSTKAMPKARFHEIYQDYVCGCMLRVAREVFAMLPMETLLVTASADLLDSRIGRMEDKPVLSAIMPRNVLAQLDFERLDPSDALENFQRRGDFKASRKAGAFQAIIPLNPKDILRSGVEKVRLVDLMAELEKMRAEFGSKTAELKDRNETLLQPIS